MNVRMKPSAVCRWMLCCVALAAGVASAQDAGDPPAIAQWAFEEAAEALVFEDGSRNPAWALKTREAMGRRRGVYGTALDLRGAHAIHAAGAVPGELAALSLTAWVRPSDTGGYREILRQESDNRLLFSFQESGGVLSLGLNINGYVECDGRLDPKQVLDGAWHFCAATFDGQAMRVYLDGVEIAAMDRPGRIALSPGVPLFVGSSGGVNEHFQGGLDEVRLYAGALPAARIDALFKEGMASIADTFEKLDADAGHLYAPSHSFSEALGNTRKNIAEAGAPVDVDLVEAVAERLRAAFPDESRDFLAWTGLTPVEYLTADAAFNIEQGRRLVNLLLEYKPLTEQQWKSDPPENAAKWAEADRIQERFEALKARGESARFAPEWIDVMLEAGRRIDFRPRVHEPVAPYITPETPPLRNLTAEEARNAIVQDWLHQAGNEPSPERIKNEILWARELIDRIPGSFSSEERELDSLERRAAKLSGPDEALFLKVRTVKRDIMFKNPLLNFDKLLLVDMPYPQGSEWRHETRHRLGYMAVPGARLLIVNGLDPAGKVTQLMPQAPLHGSFWRPDLSFDARKVLFCFKPHNEKSFHLYEINVDGSGLTQLTDGIFDDVDPVYLPDGHIMFATTRGHNYVRCMPPTNSFQLARADGDGGNIYLISYSNEPDYLPSVMDDGRVIYTRWEYTDKPLWRAQSLWTLHPDGTQAATFWGNQSVWPDLMKDARIIPGSRRVMFTGSAHHDWFAGSVGIIDPDRGLNFPNGLTKVTADTEWPECGNGPVDPVESPRYHASGAFRGYYSPFPLSEKDFLVSAQRDDKFRLYLMDVDGNRELVYEGAHNILHAIPLRPRALPPILADRVAWPTPAEREIPQPGVIYSNNVYQNAPEELRGKARYLRIWQIDAKTYTYWHKRPYISTGPVISAVQSEGVKRLIGTVPIEADGSVSFEAPAGQAFHFQLLDGEYRALQTMRSFVGVMPGESRGCLGCHESHSRAPQVGAKSIATHSLPKTITPPPWEDRTVSYARYVRPVLDQYCARCHEGDGKARKVFDMTERPAPPSFSEPYMTLIGRPAWGAPYTPPENPEPGFGIAGVLMVEAYDQRDPKAYITPPPMTSLSFRSPLVERISSGKHHGVIVDETSRQRIIAWIDAMCPYLGEEEVRAIPDPIFQGVDWLAIRPRIETAPVIPRPGPVG